MSVTNTVPVKRKAGRPKKIQPAVVLEASKDATKELAAKAVNEILSQAAVQASQTMLVSPVSIDEAKTTASSHDNLDKNQDDYIPGTRILDIQQVPNKAYDEQLGRSREVGRPNDYHYCWVHTDKITGFRINGYKFCSYNGGVGSGLADGGFSGTSIYEKTFDNHVRNGDMLLMWISLRHHEELLKDDEDYRNRMDRASNDEIHNDGYRRGIRTFKEVNGVTLYN